MSRHRERQLVGSLTNSYKFKEGGLVKKVSHPLRPAPPFLATMLTNRPCPSP